MKQLASLLALLLPLTAAAQPRLHGCLVLPDGRLPRPQPLSALERSQIEETMARSDTFDIIDYAIDLDATDYAGQSITAATTIRFKARMPGQSSIRFDLLALTVDSVIGGDGPMGFTHDGQFLQVDFEDAPPVGEERAITVHYHGQPVRDPYWGGFYFASNYVYNLGIGLTTVPPNFGKVWYPCFDSFVERATYTFRVKTAGGRRLHGQGELIEETALGGDTVIRAYRLDYAIPSHVSAIACASYAEHAYTHSGAYGDYPVTLRARANQLPAMVSRMSDLPAAIDALEHWYGPHPYDRIGYVLTTDGALEIPTNIAYPDFMPSQSQASNRRLLTHELGHHWWGDKVTPRVHNHMWLKEGPAEYSAHLLEEWVNGRAHMVGVVKDNLLRILTDAHLDDDGFRALSPMADEHIYGTHTYYKGAAVMHNLRGYLGDALFREAMRQSQQRLADTVITPEMWRDTMEAITGRDLHPFFDDWVFKPGYSVFEVRRLAVQPLAGAWEAQVRIGQKLYGTAELHGATPLSLTLVGEEGQVHEAQVTASGLLTEVAVACPFRPVMAALNRYHWLNQARMDHEVKLAPGATYGGLLPRTEFRLYADAVPDTALVRVEHIWSGADQDALGWGVQQVSTTHYWNVMGAWPEGAQLRGRLLYIGAQAGQWDHALINGDETGMVAVWRPHADTLWQIHPYQTVNAGSLTNGAGQIDINQLLKGQYAFAKANSAVGLAEPAAPAFALYPVPAAEQVALGLPAGARGAVIITVRDAQGRVVLRAVRPAAERVGLDIAALAPGAYRVSADLADGRALGSRMLVVER